MTFNAHFGYVHHLNNNKGGPNNDEWKLCRVWCACAWQMYQASSIATLKICFQLIRQMRELCHDYVEQPEFT
jgi:hypothetical protein